MVYFGITILLREITKDDFIKANFKVISTFFESFQPFWDIKNLFNFQNLKEDHMEHVNFLFNCDYYKQMLGLRANQI